MTPSSRSRTHQNQALMGEQSPLSLALSPIAARRGRGNEGWVKRHGESGGSATGNGNVGPPGLKSAGGTPWFNSRSHGQKTPTRLRTGGMPVPRRGSLKQLSVYPKHQPRRGGRVIAGAARPRGSMQRNSLLSKPMAPPQPLRCRLSGPDDHVGIKVWFWCVCG